MDKHFIATTDPDTAKALRELGFQELPKQDNRWMFLNINTNEVNFSSDKKMKVNYTNNMCI